MTNLSKINVLLGKNGSGKSTLLKHVESTLVDGSVWGKLTYITPERGGILEIQPNIEQAMISNAQWSQVRRANQFQNFRQQSASQFKNLELTVLRELEAAEDRNATEGFDSTVQKINELLDNIEIRREGSSFRIYQKIRGNPLPASDISSGEAELISLGIECLAFASEVISGKQNVLFLDEPDVHLHPDLQARLAIFLRKLVDEKNFYVIIATHSTALLGGMSDYEHAAIAFMKSGDTTLEFKPINETYKRILPVFGAHPLSNIFNSVPILLLEGEDDERVWQQAVRTSQGQIKIYPVFCGSVTKLNQYENEAIAIINAVYDHGKGYSLRDQDDTSEEIADLPPITRMKLACREAENLLLSDDVLGSLDVAWAEATTGINKWLAITENQSHSRYPELAAFKDGGYYRKSFKIKDSAVLIAGSILESKKGWEVLVGQAIGRLKAEDRLDVSIEGSLANFLGEKVINNLII